MQNFSQHPFQDQEKLKCPRCDSTDTKFCYYNNYNLAQPRHFCKGCRRYWTKGGALRNIPVGGGSRKNAKRSGSAAAVTKRLAPTEEKNDALLRPKGESSGHGQFGNLELTGKGEALPQKLVDFGQVGGFGKSDFKALPLRLGDFGQGQFGNLAEVSGSFRSLLVGSSGVRQFGGLLDGLGSSGPSLQASALFCDPGSGQNVDPQADGFLNIGGGDGGSWAAGAGGWPNLAI